MSRTHHARPRRRFSPGQIATVWARQKGLCACGCGEALVPGHYDKEHEIPLWTAQSDEERANLDTLDNLQLMLRRHHKPKTKTEATQRAKEARIKAKANGTWLKSADRELAARLNRVKQLSDQGNG